MSYAKVSLLFVAGSMLSGCATVGSAIKPPVVSLQKVDLAELDFSRQTFVLSFDVQNPNSFALPVNHVSYGVKLDDQQFASGESIADFTIPANGDGKFAISVDLDLLRTAPHLLYTVRDAASRDLAYELRGKLGIDLPLVTQLPFRKSGEIRLQARFVTRATNDAAEETP